MAQVTHLEDRTFNRRAGQLFVAVDSALNDSDKAITVPAGQIWEIREVFVTFTASAVVGDRVLVCCVHDGTEVLSAIPSNGILQAASTTYRYAFGGNWWSNTGSDDYTLPLPIHTLYSGWYIRVYDRNAVDAAADDMTVVVTGTAF